MTRPHAGPVVGLLLLAAVVAGMCTYADSRLSEPETPVPVMVTVLPTLAPTPAQPGYARPEPTFVTPEPVLWRATETPTLVPALVLPALDPTVTPTRPPATMVQRGGIDKAGGHS